ncbi:hypothetical protein K438DRAFT_1986899 [Mycena galopus ATCC 62051]|nr:hypothetical protein K438DRAFT_1986899 [Mycena galopus ATCC 62051]
MGSASTPHDARKEPRAPSAPLPAPHPQLVSYPPVPRLRFPSHARPILDPAGARTYAPHLRRAQTSTPGHTPASLSPGPASPPFRSAPPIFTAVLSRPNARPLVLIFVRSRASCLSSTHTSPPSTLRRVLRL